MSTRVALVEKVVIELLESENESKITSSDSVVSQFQSVIIRFCLLLPSTIHG